MWLRHRYDRSSVKKKNAFYCSVATNIAAGFYHVIFVIYGTGICCIVFVFCSMDTKVIQQIARGISHYLSILQCDRSTKYGNSSNFHVLCVKSATGSIQRLTRRVCSRARRRCGQPPVKLDPLDICGWDSLNSLLVSGNCFYWLSN